MNPSGVPGCHIGIGRGSDQFVVEVSTAHDLILLKHYECRETKMGNIDV
jgi:hypothetical protein